MIWSQYNIHLPAFSRGFHLITELIIAEISEMKAIEVGTLHLFLMHTSASLTINENADPTVRKDLEAHFNHLAPENLSYYQHTIEGEDDMPAHIKNCLIGPSVLIPITKGKLALGLWQGIYLCEHRSHASNRKIIATLSGKSKIN